jgi:ubiquinone/menaquinone biosynthesis C-methylase UbiE
MKHYCKPDNVLLFDATSKSEKVLSVKNFYWGPNELVINMIEQLCVRNKHKRILEIGPGRVPFNLATDWIGSNERITNYIDIDIDKEKIPYDSVDFIFCRHVLEDIQNPDFALQEIIRVSKYGGYMETPSPLIEITKDVDAHKLSHRYCGYIHHRYIVWSNIQKNEIYFLPKYSCILDHMLDITDEIKMHLYDLINNYPVYWNNYFVFGAQKPTVIMYKNGVNFNCTAQGTMAEEYIQLVTRAINESIENTNYFIRTYNH